MSGRVVIGRIAALDEFREQITWHRAEVTAALASAGRTALQTLGQIGQRVIYWQRQKDAWEAEARQRLATLRRCEAMPEEMPRDCRGPYDAWAEAARAAAQAAGNLREAEIQFNRVKEAAEQFQNEKQRLCAELEGTVTSATSTLLRVAARTREVHAGVGGVVFRGIDHPPPAVGAPVAVSDVPGGLPGAAGVGERPGIEGEPAREQREGAARRPSGAVDRAPAAPWDRIERARSGSLERG